MKAIHPIKDAATEGEVPARPGPQIPLTRREFLHGSAVLTGVLTAGSLLSTLAPSRVWAAPMANLNETEAKFLLRLTQVIFPHKNMPDAINALAVQDLDKAAADAKVAQSFRDGIAQLNQAAGGDWMAAPADKQLATVKANTKLVLFEKVRGQCISSLYNNELAFKHFGYGGDAFSQGGYITRGFNDLKWLPEPTLAASPPPYF